jgi:hypothetical protein
MEQVTTSTDRTCGLIARIASHLRHPGFGGVWGFAGAGNAPRVQVEKEEDVISNETTLGSDLNDEKPVPARAAMWVAMKSFQLVLWLRFGSGAMPWRFRMFPIV